MNESNLIRSIQILLSKSPLTRIFRNNVGTGWVGASVSKNTPDGLTVIINNARPLHAGLTEGSSDLIGWHTVEITPDMVGKKIAIFLALEAKTAIGRASPKQINFLSQVRQCGGISGIARTPEEASEIISKSVQLISTK